MYKILSYAVCLLPAVAFGQNYGQPVNAAQMQQLMQQAQRLQTCMANVDQEALNAVQQRSAEMDAELKSLCAAGQRDAAMSRAVEYAKEMADNPALKAMAACGQSMQTMLPNLPAAAIPQQPEDSPQTRPRHVCDR